MKFLTTTTLAVLALASSTLAHFTLDYPLTRGFDEDLENNNFCGGFSNPLLPRQPWYYRNGPVSIDSHHDAATVNIYISYSLPNSSQSFLAAPPLRQDLAIKGEGEFCFHANATAAGTGAGTNATLMVEFISNVHGHLYQCSDVVFTDDASVGSNVTCTDSLTAAASSGGGEENTTTTTSSTSPAAQTSAPARSNSNGAEGTVRSMGWFAAVVPVFVAGALSLA
ncbi:hypothetical protein PSEUBRA_003350 [Kalmanozyma brasiliensis GHG001]|uniref:Copper acquisition factor BIM1-like domain-containing protein n=1 Tax=Kalmanozyma brasiliensis (strain GHG001) TaxID=1365824 RepID=V5EQ01_KALBG|nr:uncharacterized protein PSEUBRA_003350 [Kalmanozyma brasiliensis GHG001]EST07185.1 hypothetical protein PSEUBRA_003350 [Kalmanozyma brasiliensis GHG001]